MSDSFRPITLESLVGPTPNAASVPGGAFQNFLSSALRSGTSEMVGLEGDWTQGITGVSPQQNDEWRNRNFLGSVLSQLVGAVPAYMASAAVTGPLAAAPAVARVAPWAARTMGYGRFADEGAALAAAAPVRTLATQAVLTTVPISAARLGLTPVLGGDLERVATSVGIDLAGSAVMGAGFGLYRGIRGGQLVQDSERLLAQRIDTYNLDAPPQERLGLLETFNPADDAVRVLRDRTIEGLRQAVRTENAPSMLRGNNWLGPLEGEETATIRATRTDLNRLFRPTEPVAEGGGPRALQVQTLSVGRTGFDSAQAWRDTAAEIGLPNNWETVLQYPRVVTANAEQAPRIQNNLQRHLGDDVGDGWRIRREANQDLYVVSRQLAPAADGRQRWFMARTNAPERLLPLPGSLRRGDKLARFIGQAEENLLAKAVSGLPEDDILRMGMESLKFRPPGLRGAKPQWSMLEHFPAPLANAAKEAQPLANELWRKTKSVIAPTQNRFRDRPLASFLLGQAKSIYEMAQGKAARALHGSRPTTQPLSQLVRGLPDQGGLRKLFDAMQDGDTAFVSRYARLREQGKLSLDDALTAARADVDPAVIERAEPVIREWDRVAREAWDELLRTAAATGTKVPKEVEGWAIPHTWPGDWRQKIRLDDRTTHIVGGRTREEVQRAARSWVDENGGTLDPAGAFQTDRKGDYELLRERSARRIFIDSPRITEFGNVKRRQAKPAGGYVGQQPPTKEELWDILSNDITMKYQDIAQRTVQRGLTQGMLPEIKSKYGTPTTNEVIKQLNVMRGEQGEFSRWQNRALSFLDPLLGKNSASKIAATANAIEAHFAFGFGNLAFPAGNAVTAIQTVAPKLAMMRQMGPGRISELFDFMPSYGPDGVPDGAFAAMSPTKVMKAAFRSLTNPSEQDRVFFNRAVEEGVIAARIKDEYLGTSSRFMQNMRAVAKGEEPVTNLMRALATGNMALPHRVEELTRAHAFFSWVRAGEGLNMTPDALYEFAKRGTWSSMYGYAQADRPRMFTGPVGMMAGLFKNWMFNYIGDLVRYTGEASRGNMAGLTWALGGTLATAGLGGLPLWALVEQGHRMFSDSTLVEELYSATGTEAGDALYYGMPGLFGVSLQGMMAAPFNDPRRDLSFMFNVVTAERARRVGQIVGDTWERWRGGGENPLTQDRTWDQLAFALAPRTIYRLTAQVEDGALKSIRNGRPIIEGIGEFERGLNAVGLSSTRIARAWEASESLWADQERRRANTTMFAEAYSDAMAAGDNRAMQNVIERAIESGSDLSSVMRGAMERQRGLRTPQMPMDYLRVPGAYDRLQRLGLVQ
jgi:hypothetical protein